MKEAADALSVITSGPAWPLVAYTKILFWDNGCASPAVTHPTSDDTDLKS